MCTRPCFGTVKDIQKLIDAGYGEKLTLDFHCGKNPDAIIFILTPALKGHEGKATPYIPCSKLGCTFYRYGKCDLHRSGLKPTGGKLAIHDNKFDRDNTLSNEISEMWNSEEGRTLVEKWCKERNIPIEKPQCSFRDAITLLSLGKGF
jgi:hypothetical protein